LKEVRLYIAAKRPNAPSFPMFAVSIAAPLNGAPREVDVFKEAARLAYNVTQHEVDLLNVGVDPRAAGRLKGVEQTIGMRAWLEP